MTVSLLSAVFAPCPCVSRRTNVTPLLQTRTRVVARSQKQTQREGLSEPEQDSGYGMDHELASERALVDGKHVLVLVDAKGARLYRTLFTSAFKQPERLVPLIRYNHSSKKYYDSLETPNERTQQTRSAPQRSHQHATSTGKTSHPKSQILPDAIARAVMTQLTEINPETVLVAAHGKGKGDASKALVSFAKKHNPELFEKFIGEALHLESQSGGKHLTDPQVLATARRAYRNVLAPKVPLDPAKHGFTHGRRVKHL